ncbi:thymidylate kinase-like [Clavelina lepadiformis]|uniref:thymidylate kinase-like n=1 Tax=Clavelina lepadiformis TaxID=159417 RepID=UPI0040437BEA
MSGRGALVVVEGIDRSGKTTQCAKLVSALLSQGHKVEAMKFPDRTTKTGKMINAYLQRDQTLDDHVVHLLFSANRWEQCSNMLENLHKGVSLIVDRYAYSGAAYTSAKQGFTLDWCKNPDKGLPDPDLVLFLNLSSKEAESRGGYGDEIYEKVEFQKKVHNNFLQLKSKQWKVIDASQSEENVHREMLNNVNSVIENVKGQQIGKLWLD